MRSQKKTIVFQFAALALLLQIPTLAFGKYDGSSRNPRHPEWYWEWRQPPFIISFDELGYPNVLPSSESVTWGGANNNEIFSETMDDQHISPHPKGIYYSTDHGITWKHMPYDFNGNDIQSLTIHPITHTVILAGTFNHYFPGGMYRSSDGGDSWKNVLPDRIIYHIEVDPITPNRIFASTCCWGGIFRSDDYGQIWKQVSDQALFDIEAHPTQKDVLFGARYFSTNPEEGIYRSDDSGETWTQIAFLDGQSRIIIDPSYPNRMYSFGRGYGGIWRTEDGGKNWVNLSAGLPHVIADPSVLSAVIDPQDDSLWIGLKYDGMLVSYDHGNTWEEVNNGIPFFGGGIFGPQCTSIAISSNDDFAINCSGRLYVRVIIKTTFLPAMINQ
jgi:photosystem II stability/assembly factor-like uncharacterized protein